MGVVTRVDRFDHFIGFFEKIGAETGVRLFAVPRAAVRRAKPCHDATESLYGRRIIHAAGNPEFSQILHSARCVPNSPTSPSDFFEMYALTDTTVTNVTTKAAAVSQLGNPPTASAR